MRVIFVYFAFLSLIELIIYFSALWSYRRLLGLVLSSCLALGCVLLVFTSFDIWSFLILWLMFYRIFNAFRAASQKPLNIYVRNRVQITSLALIVSQLILGAMWLTLGTLTIGRQVWLGIGLSVTLIGSVILYLSLRGNLKSMNQTSKLVSYADSELPTLTVAIPARNETDDLDDCLNTIIANSYPKLEVVVLDDNSTNKRTPEIIRSFAHDGVRFIKGSEPSGSWLAKNQAYQRLYQESSGEIILFCGTDVRFNPDSLKKIVFNMLSSRKRMLGVMPKNIACSVGLLAWLIQPMRYAWEVVLPRSYFNRPAVLSTCWIIYREELERLGAFAAVSHKIVPESYFAKEEMKKGVYSFVMSNDQLAVESIKNVDDQLDTAIRTRYPQFHRKPEYICLSGLIEMLLALLPIACLCYMFSRFNFYLTFLSVVDIFTLSTLFGLIMNTTYQRKLWILGLLFPFGLAFDVFISNYSMWKYEFSQIIWKGRDVSNIVMRVYPKLS